MIIILGLTYFNPYCSRLPVNYKTRLQFCNISSHLEELAGSLSHDGWVAKLEEDWRFRETETVRLEQEMRRLCQISQIHTTVRSQSFPPFTKGPCY